MYKLIIFDLDDTLIGKGIDVSQSIDLLKRLKGRYKLVLLSNSSKKSVDKKLKYYKLGKYFDRVYSRSYFFNRKPLPFKYWQILHDFNVDRHEVIAIGDKIITDILGAKLLGIKTILLMRNKKIMLIKPTYTVKNILDIKDILLKLP